jgi:asparagine synthase (glutamine-hydrolysing)
MCGILFINNFNSKINVLLAKKSLYLMEHRGPDDAKIISYKNYVFGFNRLAINKIVNGTQPFYDEVTKLIVMLNGEIFNYRELISELKTKYNIEFNNITEVELLSKLYFLHGSNFFNLLDGQFSIVIHDIRKNLTIFGRDDFGITPLFWTKTNTGFYASSEIKALKLFVSNIIINDESIINTALFWTNVGEQSSFKNIFQFLPGYVYIFKNQTLSKKKFSQINFDQKTIPLKNNYEYYETFNEKFEKAVKKRVLCDKNIKYGCYLSGGIDSFLVGKKLKKFLKKDLSYKSFSIDFENKFYSERKYQLIANRNINLSNKKIIIKNADIINNFSKCIYHTETPIFRTAPVPMMLLSKAVREQGLKFILTGEGADEMLLGYDIFKLPKINDFLKRNLNSNFRYYIMKNLYNHLPQYQKNKYLKLVSVIYSNKNIFTKTYPYHYYRWGNNLNLMSIFNKSINVSIDKSLNLLNSLVKEKEKLGQAQQIEKQTLLSNYLLSSQGDRMLMANSIEGRYPFLDKDLVKLTINMPTNLKLHYLQEKYILKKTYEKIIPTEIKNRNKFPYQAPDMSAFANKEIVSEYFSNKNIKNLGIFSSAFIKNLSNKLLNEKKLHSNFDNSSFVLILSTLILKNQFDNLRVNYDDFKKFNNKVKIFYLN